MSAANATMNVGCPSAMYAKSVKNMRNHPGKMAMQTRSEPEQHSDNNGGDDKIFILKKERINIIAYPPIRPMMHNMQKPNFAYKYD